MNGSVAANHPTGTLPFDQIARLPEPLDNAAIALKTLRGGSQFLLSGAVTTITHTVLEGHRFAVRPIRKGDTLLSWGLPFGIALRDIAPGEYLCNEKILKALRGRSIDFELPPEPNFRDHRLPVQLDRYAFSPGQQVPRRTTERFFSGFYRNERRGSGTRNYIVILGTSSRSGAFCRKLAEAFAHIHNENLHGIVAVAHTEGGGLSRPNNFERTLHTLAGFMVNPNVAAVLAIDSGNEPINNQHLRDYLAASGYPTDGLLHEFRSIGSNADKAFNECSQIIHSWIPAVSNISPALRPVSELKLGLQCGGSDAFSGISGNPLLGIMARETVAHGGIVSLAETSELIGAESYILQNVRDFETAEKFVATLDRFQEWAGWHGHSAEGNPSGGNMFRGLYNIAIKSIGAARKKDPQVRLDYVIDYGNLMPQPGFYFMDSPGNDLESIAGQVASGCNMILFATGNGSITNFPFVPTIKIMTTTSRFELVRREMDINAGRYLDGEPLEKLGEEAFDYLLEIASGKKSAGELAGHSQVQLWREWRQTARPKAIHQSAPLSGNPLPFSIEADTIKTPTFSIPKVQPRFGLILPTSLCSGEITKMIAAELNKRSPAEAKGLRYAALAHTEGCGNSAGDSEALFVRTMVGYINHPLVARTLLLEHGCEKTHNDAYRAALEQSGHTTETLGWASVQMDGGIREVTQKVITWFAEPSLEQGKNQVPLRLGLIALAPLSKEAKTAIAKLISLVLAKGGSVIIPEVSSENLLEQTKKNLSPTLAYGQVVSVEGLHVMDCPSSDFLEITTGLGGSGATLMLSFSHSEIYPAHPIVPLVQIGLQSQGSANFDLLLETSSPETMAAQLLQMVAKAFTGEYIPRNFARDFTAFQITRGQTGISL